jgi:probable rRNA maturation factor
MSAARNNPEYDIRITVEIKPFPIDPARLRTLVRKVLRQFEIPAACADIAVVDDSAIRQMHARYLGRPKITDVISFDLSEDPRGCRCFQILVNAQEAARQAARRGHLPQAELALYIVHGLLHNLGFDDAAPAQARRMHRMEDRLLEQVGCGAVYYHQEFEYGKEFNS